MQIDKRYTMRSWEWNKDRWGYDGVHTHEGKLVWFTHKHNPHGGGGACTQEFADFLKSGPSVFAPSEVVSEVRKVIEEIIKEQD